MTPFVINSGVHNEINFQLIGFITYINSLFVLLPLYKCTLTSYIVYRCDTERLKSIRCPDPCRPFDPCGEKGLCYKSTPPPCDEWFCYNCFTEGSCKVRAKEFCLDCDVSMCEKCLQVCHDSISLITN